MVQPLNNQLLCFVQHEFVICVTITTNLKVELAKTLIFVQLKAITARSLYAYFHLGCTKIKSSYGAYIMKLKK